MLMPGQSVPDPHVPTLAQGDFALSDAAAI